MDEKPADPLEERRRWLAKRTYVAAERGWVLKSELTGDVATKEFSAVGQSGRLAVLA
jgi:hypothetical protein